MEISDITRRNITDEVRAKNIAWRGRLSESEFLNRIFNLKDLPSEETWRHKNMEEDLWQHRVNNPQDWKDDWVYGDSRLNLAKGKDEIFLQFLCEMVHPLIRNDEGETKELLMIFNKHLKNDGFQITTEEMLSGKPLFKATRTTMAKTPNQKNKLSQIDKMKFEKFFGMGSGYVLDFSNATFGDFFLSTIGIDISGEEYNSGSGSKANRMRAFWSQDSDDKIGKILFDMLEYWKAKKLMDGSEIQLSDQKLYEECFRIAQKLLGESQSGSTEEDEFLQKEFKSPSLDKLNINLEVSEILSQRFKEIEKGLNAKMPLATIFLIGSTLEGILLGIALKDQELFNQSISSPKDKNGKVLQFSKWTLSSFIDVAYDVGLLELDTKKFSHSLRDFRNYIHPHEQAASKFNPNEHTAQICWQVIRAAIFELSKQHKS